MPTHSSTWWAPPPVISRTRATASSPRSVTTSVAPKPRAISSRSGWWPSDDDPLRAQAMGGEHPAEPDGAVADDHGGAALGSRTTGRRVVAGAHHVGEGGDGGGQAGVGEVNLVGQRHQGAVGERRPHRLALAAVVLAAPVAAGAGTRSAGRRGSRRRCRRSRRTARSPLARADRAHVGADGLDDAHELVAGPARPPVDLQLAAVGPQVAAADAGVGHAHERVGRLADRRVGTSSTRTSRGPW